MTCGKLNSLPTYTLLAGYVCRSKAFKYTSDQKKASLEEFPNKNKKKAWTKINNCIDTFHGLLSPVTPQSVNTLKLLENMKPPEFGSLLDYYADHRKPEVILLKSALNTMYGANAYNNFLNALARCSPYFAKIRKDQDYKNFLKIIYEHSAPFERLQKAIEYLKKGKLRKGHLKERFYITIEILSVIWEALAEGNPTYTRNNNSGKPSGKFLEYLDNCIRPVLKSEGFNLRYSGDNKFFIRNKKLEDMFVSLPNIIKTSRNI